MLKKKNVNQRGWRGIQSKSQNKQLDSVWWKYFISKGKVFFVVVVFVCFKNRLEQSMHTYSSKLTRDIE